MIIKIKQCSSLETNDVEYWYKDKIGEEFEVEWDTDFYYFVKNDRGANFINKKDIEFS